MNAKEYKKNPTLSNFNTTVYSVPYLHSMGQKQPSIFLECDFCKIIGYLETVKSLTLVVKLQTLWFKSQFITNTELYHITDNIVYKRG